MPIPWTTLRERRPVRVLEDKRAERDGNWLRSDKHNMLVPYQEPAQVMRARAVGDYGVPTGDSMLIVDRDPDPEWVTEFWRQGGYLDQQYLLARDGRLPEQIHTAYRQKQIRTALWVVSIPLVIIDAIMLAKIFIPHFPYQPCMACRHQQRNYPM